jgi:hypothetical protein
VESHLALAAGHADTVEASEDAIMRSMESEITPGSVVPTSRVRVMVCYGENNGEGRRYLRKRVGPREQTKQKEKERKYSI